MKKRLLPFVLVLTLALLLLPVSVQANEAHTDGYDHTYAPAYSGSGRWGDNIQWSINGTTLTLTGEGAVEPEDYDAFVYFPWNEYETVITHVVVGEGITDLAQNTFSGFSALLEVQLPSTLKTIGNHCFYECRALTGITLPASLTKIGESAFGYCLGLTELELPASLEAIGGYAFSGCSGLNRVVIPDSVVTLGSHMFQYCYALETVVLPAGLTVIPEHMFYNSGIKEIQIPEGITSVDRWAFASCSQLQSVRLPESLRTIGESAFYSCDALTSISLPEGLTGLPESAFNSCLMLTDITLPSTLTQIGKLAFFNTGLISVEIPAGVANVGDDAFGGCSYLEDVVFLGDQTTLSSGCFKSCYNLRQIVLPDGLTMIPDHCFFGSGLEYIEIPERVETILGAAFLGCESLQEVVIHPNVTKIEFLAFDSCPNLTISCYAQTRAHLYALMNGIPVSILPEDAGLVSYPLSVYASRGGSIAVSADTCPENRFVLVQITPDEGYFLASMVYYRTDGSEEELVYEQISDYEYLIVMPPCELILDVTFLLTELPFVDVPQTEYYFLPVLWAVSDGITAGTDATHFTPAASCTRAQVVTFLWRTAGQPEPTITDNPFVDVSAEDYFYKAVLWALENGITAGMDATHFNPNGGCTRAQVVTFLWRACGKPEPGRTDLSFDDVKPDAYYYNAVLWAAEYQITSGVSATQFSPDTICTRAQIVTFLFRTFY